ncbi:Tubby-like F-box protein [Rhynchospora pubera]|uniref:Tubby-like F-box protein n=1 Tax=Rhynchospora pubera TaxID=906938 RepID=A0AAV8H554_9POAL|nr:Tubby-like F-box protein [Rhynchospora pubera]
MSFRKITRDVRDGVGSLSRRSFEAALAGISGLTGHSRGKAGSSVHQVREAGPVVQDSKWASLPPELLRDVIRRLEASESVWPGRKNVVACAAVCRSWREMCMEIVISPEFSGKLTFPVSLKQPGPRDGMMQCFIKRDKSKLTYHLYLGLSPAVLVENGKFLMSAKRSRKATCTEYIISMDADHISRSSSTYIGKIRSNFLGTKFIVYDTQPPYYIDPSTSNPGRSSRRFTSKKVSPKVPSGNYSIAQVSYELNVLGTRGPRRMHCIMNSIPAASVEPNGTVPGQPDRLISRNAFEESFRSTTSTAISKSIMDPSEFNSSRYLDDNIWTKERPLVLKNKPPRWHEQLQCWCLNFRGRVTIASVKNFQLIAASQASPGGPSNSGASGPQVQVQAQAQPQPQPQGQAGPAPQPTASASSPDHDKIILQFGKVAKDMFTMDYRYPLSAFQAFAICLSSFDTKLACE